MYVLCTQLHLTLCNAMDCSPPGSLSMEFSRQEYWNGLSFPTPGDFLSSLIEPTSFVSPTLADGLIITSATSEALFNDIFQVVFSCTVQSSNWNTQHRTLHIAWWWWVSC